jgi:hypothetical protein
MQNPFKSILRALELPYKTLLGDASTKTVKGESIGFLTAILYLTPSIKLCPFSELAKCLEGCLFSSGRGAFDSVKLARQLKTEFFESNQLAFMLSLCADIWSYERKAEKLGLKLLVRLNGTSDITFENIYFWANMNIFQMFPNSQFYDYTKHPSRNLKGKTNDNYDLTYSYSGCTPKGITDKGFTNPNNSRVAVVFMRKEDIPNSFNNLMVIDGDNTDVRHIEPKNVIVSLYAKGKAKRDTSGFVQIKGIHYA